jgi:hypothetical protein
VSQPLDDQKDGDELLEKLNQLLKRHRPGEGRTLEPPAADGNQIPVLTDAVSGPALSRSKTEPQQPEAVIESRLSAAIGREVNRLQVEMPRYSRQLATLSTALAAAVRLLTGRYLAENQEARSDDPEPRS